MSFSDFKGETPDLTESEKKEIKEEKSEPTVLNLVLLGTGYHHLQPNKKHILLDLVKSIDTQTVDSKESKTKQNQFLHIIDGIGGKITKRDLKGTHFKTTDHPMLGTYQFNKDGIKVATSSTVDPISDKFPTKIPAKIESKIEIEEKTLQDSEKEEKETKEEQKSEPTKTYNTIQIDKQPISQFSTTSTTETKAKITGKGFKSGIMETVALVLKMVEAGKTPLTLNMYGFSRGADTALRISNVLNAQYGREMLKVNIFAIDPVPGTGRRSSAKARLVPSIVEEYKSILMSDEATPGFEPTDKRRLIVQDPDSTKVSTDIYRGIHGGALNLKYKPKKSSDKKAIENANAKTNISAKMLWLTIQDFAEAHGTRIKETGLDQTWKDADKKIVTTPSKDLSGEEKKLSPEERKLNLYSQMIIHDAAFQSRKAQLLGKREFVTRKDDFFLHGTDYFMDEAHLNLFCGKFPVYFDYFFQAGREFIKADDAKRREMQASLRDEITLISENENLIQSLKQLGYITKPDLVDSMVLPAALDQKIIMQDSKEIKPFHDQYPHYFDYFFNNGRKYFAATEDQRAQMRNAMEKELEKMKFQDILLFSVLEKQNYPTSLQKLTFPQGIPVTVDELGLGYNGQPQNELARLWHGIQTITNQILVGNDDSAPKTVAQELHDKTIQILKMDLEPSKKVEVIQDMLATKVLLDSNPKLSWKLAGIVGNAEIYAKYIEKVLNGLALSEAKNPTQNTKIASYINNMREDIHKIMLSDADDKTKIDKMSWFAKDMHTHYTILKNVSELRPQSNKWMKLVKNIVKRLEMLVKFKKPTQVYADIATRKLGQYLNRFQWFGSNWFGLRNAALTTQKNIIAEHTLLALDQIRLAGFGNDKATIHFILKIAQRCARELRIGEAQYEGQLDKVLRQFTIDLASFNTLPKTPEQVDKLNDIIKKYEKQLKSSLTIGAQITPYHGDQKISAAPQRLFSRSDREETKEEVKEVKKTKSPT